MSDAPALIVAPLVGPSGAQTGDALSALREAIMALDTRRAELAEAGDVNALAIGLSSFRKLVADLRLLDAAIEADLAALLPGRERHVLDGIGVLQVRTSSSDKWDGPALLRRLTSRLVDPVTGEAVNAIRTEVLDKVLPQASSASASWKVTGLQQIGVDPDQFRDKTYGRKTITITEG